MKYRRKQTIILLLILLLAFMGIGYAFITTTLNIDGTTDVDANNWNVYWNNVQITDGSVSGDQVTTSPTIDSNKTLVNFQVRLSKPGEFYEFTIDVVNDGSIDAMVDVFSKKINGGDSIPEFLKYTVSYADGVDISKGDLLTSNTTEKYKVRLEYSDSINPNQLPSTYASYAITFEVTYVQADNNAKERIYCGFHYPAGKNLNSVVVGDRVSTMSERFYVSKVTSDYIIAVPEYNIELSTDYPVQSINAGTTTFASNVYWPSDDIDMFYKSDGINYSNNVQQYIDAYYRTLEVMCAKNYEVRIMKYADYSSSVSRTIYNPSGTGSYWLGTPSQPDYDYGLIRGINSSGSMIIIGISQSHGVRPVLVIYKGDLINGK